MVGSWGIAQHHLKGGGLLIPFYPCYFIVCPLSHCALWLGFVWFLIEMSHTTRLPWVFEHNIIIVIITIDIIIIIVFLILIINIKTQIKTKIYITYAPIYHLLSLFILRYFLHSSLWWLFPLYFIGSKVWSFNKISSILIFHFSGSPYILILASISKWPPPPLFYFLNIFIYF